MIIFCVNFECLLQFFGARLSDNVFRIPFLLSSVLSNYDLFKY